MVKLDSTGIEVNGDGIQLQNLYVWASSSEASSGDGVAARTIRIGAGAIVSGLAGLALLGPVGGAVGAVWGGSESSSPDARPDTVFTFSGMSDNCKAVTFRVSFVNQDVARRLRMLLPMYTGMTSGEKRRPEILSVGQVRLQGKCDEPFDLPIGTP